MKNILMNVEMTKAILDGRKVQTRRVIKISTVTYDNSQILEPDSCVKFDFTAGGCQNYSVPAHFENSKYQIGDVVWIREPARVYYCHRDYMKIRCEYLADKETIQLDIPSRFCKQTKNGWLPNWMRRKKGIPNGCIKEMARIFLKITDVRVERLKDCYTFEHLEAEGIKSEYENGISKLQEEMQDEWMELWNKTAPKGYDWDSNPFVFVYEFERVNQDGDVL